MKTLIVSLVLVLCLVPAVALAGGPHHHPGPPGGPMNPVAAILGLPFAVLGALAGPPPGYYYSSGPGYYYPSTPVYYYPSAPAYAAPPVYSAPTAAYLAGPSYVPGPNPYPLPYPPYRHPAPFPPVNRPEGVR